MEYVPEFESYYERRVACQWKRCARKKNNPL